MKKIYVWASLVAVILFSACEDFNEKNFPGYDQAAVPTNVVTYNYTLVDADYSTIAAAIKKPTTDSIAAMNTALTIARRDSSADTVAIKAIIAALNVRLTTYPLYVKATAMAKNKVFNDTISASTYVPMLLDTKYMYGDEKSVAMITYNKFTLYDTTKIATANKYSLLTEDYDAMGTTAGLPGQYDNFSSSIDPAFYIPVWLKIKNPYAKKGDVKLIRYKYFYSSTNTQLLKGIFTFDGTNWVMYSTSNPETAKFVQKDGSWQFVDSDVLVALKDGIDQFTAINVVGDQVWAWDAYKYMKMTGYVSGAYFDNEDWLVSPAMSFADRTNLWLTFNHVGRYFGDTGTDKTKMKEAISVWISTTSDGKTIVPSEWKQLTIPEAGYPSGANWNLITSTPISLKAYAGKTNVRIAFKYLSSKANNAAGTWEVKDVWVYEE